MNNARNIECLAIDEIVVPEGRRHVQENKVKDLADSMALIRLLEPIKIRMQNDKPHLIDGLHRLSAARTLGWLEIDCEVVEADDRRVRMMEIAANLHRAELVQVERSEAITEWVRLAEEARDEFSAQAAQKLGPGRPEGGLSAAEREIGVDRHAIRRAQKIAALPIQAKAAARELGLADNQAALLKAAKSRDPVTVLQQHASRKRHPPEAVAERRASRASALDRVSTLLIEKLGDRIAELVMELETITTGALVNALRERCPELRDTGHNDGLAGEQSDQVLPSEAPVNGEAELPSQVRQLRQTKTADVAKALSRPAGATERAAEQSATSADELVEIVRELKPNTQLRAVSWVERGRPEPDPTRETSS